MSCDGPHQGTIPFSMSNTLAQHKAKKRNDIQGLRAVAIIGVLLFHLFPERFINGFLGVDTFFVLSGYLMSSILSRESIIDGRVIKTFYTRRFKRIVPLYSIMLAILTVVTPLIFLPSDVTHFVTDLEWALPFAENMQNVLKQFNYWDEVFSSPILLHAWSLGVEIQYYLIVPLITTVARVGGTRRYRLLTFTVLIGGSYALNLFASSSVSFGLLFSRVWQFLTGSIFFELEGVIEERPLTVSGPCEYQPVADLEKLLEEDEDEFDDIGIGSLFFSSALTSCTSAVNSMKNGRQKKWSCSFTPLLAALSYIVTGYVMWLMIISSSGQTINRLLVTVVTGNLLLVGTFTQNKILSNDVMVYIGDLSYLIYLAHWPVIILYKYYNDFSNLTVAEVSFCVLVTLFVSVLLHHTLERFFIQSSTTVATVLVAVIYTLIVLSLLVGVPLRLSEYKHGNDQPQSAERPGFSPTMLPPSVPNIPSNVSAYSIAPTLITAIPATWTKQDVIQYNQEQSKVVYFKNPADCVRDYEAERWTGITDEAALRCISVGNGTAKVLVMGNSYGYRAFPVLHRLFTGRYSQMRMFTKSSRVFLTKDPKSTFFASKERLVVEKFQPDITFLIEKDSFSTLMKPITGTAETDPITKELQIAVDILSNNSGTVVIDRQYYKTHGKDGIAYTIQKRLQLDKMNFDDLSVSRNEYEAEFANESVRMATIKKDNVIVNDLQSQLCPGDRCYFFNRENLHSYYGDVASHLTTKGLKCLELKYSEIIEDFLLRLASSNNEESFD